MSLVGAHVSIAGGLDKAIDNGVKIDAQAIQTFASSPRTLKFKPVSDQIIELYKEKRETSEIKYHVFHGIYLINLANENPEMVEKGIESLVNYQHLAGKIGGAGTVFHVGSHKGKGMEAVIGQVAAAIAKVLEQTPDSVALMLENAAGHKGTIGQTFDELKQIIDEVAKINVDTSKLGICLDTQHGFAGGYDITKAEVIDQMLAEIDEGIGLDKLKLIHVNDSLTPMGSQRDRHANVGEGEIGREAFERLINHQQLRNLPFILEVPGEEKSGPRKQDVEQLREMING